MHTCLQNNMESCSEYRMWERREPPLHFLSGRERSGWEQRQEEEDWIVYYFRSSVWYRCSSRIGRIGTWLWLLGPLRRWQPYIVPVKKNPASAQGLWGCSHNTHIVVSQSGRVVGIPVVHLGNAWYKM